MKSRNGLRHKYQVRPISPCESAISRGKAIKRRVVRDVVVTSSQDIARASFSCIFQIKKGTDLPPLSPAITVLEEALVERDSVLTVDKTELLLTTRAEEAGSRSLHEAGSRRSNHFDVG